MAKMVALVVRPLSQNKYIDELRNRMKSYYNFIERAAKNVGVTTSSRWKSFNYRYGFGGGYRNGNDNGNGDGNGGDSSNGNGNGGNGNGVGGGGGLGESFTTLPLHLEIPKTPQEFQLGLMFRESLDKDSGMLFIFNEDGEKSFHMKNTTIPLDIAFINKDGIIESIKELVPLRTGYVYSEADVLYALEVNKGWFVENNVKVGDKILNCGDD